MTNEQLPLVTFLIGPPGAGKTTYLQSKNLKPKEIVMSRDAYRKSFKGNYKSDQDLENLITKTFRQDLLTAVADGYDVILDNTHCNKKSISSTLSDLKGKALVKMINFDVPLAELKRRNVTREIEKKVPIEVIERMSKGYVTVFKDNWIYNEIKIHNQGVAAPSTISFNSDLKTAIIVDIDGTVAHMGDLRGPFDWHRVDVDEPDFAIIKLVGLLSKQYEIIFVSGRDSSCRELTEIWLNAYVGVEHKLFMRPTNDYRKDSLIKEEIFNNHIRNKYNILFVLDDRDQVVKTWRDLGLKCLQVAPGDF